MSIKFTVNKKTNTLNSKAPEKYYAKAIADGEVEFDELLKILSKKSRISTVDCLRLLLFLEETIDEQLKDGKIVRLGNMGSFQVGITSTGEATEDKVTAKTINGAKVNFRVGKSFRELLKELEYEKVKN